MNIKKIVLILSLLPVFFCIWVAVARSSDNQADAILGVWLSGTGKAKIKIFKDAESKYHGKIVWLRDPHNEEGKPKMDKNNPDEAKKKTPLLGLQNLRNFVYDGEKKWIDGQIYDPENGSDYSCKMELIDNNTLEVRGFIGISLFGRTDVWKRQVLKAK